MMTISFLVPIYTKTGFKMNCYNAGSKIDFSQNKLTLSINNQMFVIDIGFDEIYALTIKPLKHIPNHYHVKLLFEHENRPSKEKIIKEKSNGKFVQCVDIYTMLKKIDTSLVTNLPNFLFIDNSKHNNNDFQLLNLDYVSGFDILSQSDYQNEYNQTTQQHFFHVSYQTKQGNLVITYRNSCTSFADKEHLKVPGSIVFNYLIDCYSIEVNIVEMMNAIKQTKHSSKLTNTIQFITEHKLDVGYIQV